MRFVTATLLLLSCSVAIPAANLDSGISGLMNSARDMERVPFREVIHAATGRRVLPLNMTNATDRELIARIGGAMDEVLRKLNSPEGPAQKKRRINEVSALFEAAMKAELNRIDGFHCDFPKLASGVYQRSGYPDLRLVDRRSGRIIYLDPKLFERGGRASSLRTFYYEPKRETNKILDDAHHVIVGFEHDGKENASWKFLSWELVDLSNFQVRLKAEFQAGNRELYRPEAIVATSRTNSSAGTRIPDE